MIPFRLLIADDQRLFAEGLKSILETRDSGVTVVGIANNGAEAVAQTLEFRPDAVLMDVMMPEMDGIEATASICAQWPEAKILMLTTFDDGENIRAALAAGALGYVLKDISVQDLLGTLKGLTSQSVVLGKAVMKALTSDKVPRPATVGAAPAWVEKLSPREREILWFVTEGCNNYDISRRLNLSEQTVKNYISGIYAKLDIHDRYLLIKALEGVKNLLEPDPTGTSG